MKKSEQSNYLSLSQASQFLGVHSTTLRRWADAGAVPVFLTPGGHRRFAVADIEALAARKSVNEQALATSWVRRALAQARTELERVDEPPDWLIRLDDNERAAWRQVSMRLMGIVLRYVSAHDNDEGLLEEARNIGTSYAQNAQRFGMSLTTALEAALFFRDTLIEAAMEMPERTGQANDVSVQLLRRISRVLNVVQLAVAAGYEDELS
jgi:excisionase family DNA binding protein